MSLSTQINSLAQGIGNKVKDLYTKQGTLTNLSTTDKTNLVNAINEVLTKANAAAAGGAGINDAAPSTTSTYSSQKIVDGLAALKAEILGGANSAYDTLLEIQNFLQSSTNGLDALLAAVNNRVRFDAAQTLTAGQQLQACQNIGVGDPTTDFVATFNAALV